LQSRQQECYCTQRQDARLTNESICETSSSSSFWLALSLSLASYKTKKQEHEHLLKDRIRGTTYVELFLHDITFLFGSLNSTFEVFCLDVDLSQSGTKASAKVSQQPTVMTNSLLTSR
jgi:hypothetical protein